MGLEQTPTLKPDISSTLDPVPQGSAWRTALQVILPTPVTPGEAQILI